MSGQKSTAAFEFEALRRAEEDHDLDAMLFVGSQKLYFGAHPDFLNSLRKEILGNSTL